MRPTDFIFILIPAMATLALSAIALKLVGQMTRKNSTWCFWLAVGIVVAIAATAFLMSTFETARDNVPDPVAP